MTGFIDLHCHYLPGIDDGVRSAEEGVSLLRGLREIGYRRVVATPHMRTAMFPNDRAGIEESFAAFAKRAAAEAGLPELGLGSEHFFDDVFWKRFSVGEALPYPGARAILIELSPRQLPLGLHRAFFEMGVRQIRPVLAHPERYEPLYRRTDPLEPLLDAGALPLLDLMSLVGHYGRRPRIAAERMLEEGVYQAACSDCHRPADVEVVAAAIRRLRELVGNEEAEALLSTGPEEILEGTAPQ